MASKGNGMTSKETAILMTFFILQLQEGRGVENSTFWYHSRVMARFGISIDWHTREILKEFCKRGIMDRLWLRGAWHYRLLDTPMEHFKSQARFSKIWMVQVDE